MPSRALAKSVNEKAALQALNGGSLEDVIRVRGARQHNLKNVDVTVPQVLPLLRQSSSRRESQLTSLSIGYPASPPRDPVRTAAFLTEHFPQLIKVSFRARPRVSTETDGGWHMVNSLLLAFCFVREQERD